MRPLALKRSPTAVGSPCLKRSMTMKSIGECSAGNQVTECMVSHVIDRICARCYKHVLCAGVARFYAGLARRHKWYSDAAKSALLVLFVAVEAWSELRWLGLPCDSARQPRDWSKTHRNP